MGSPIRLATVVVAIGLAIGSAGGAQTVPVDANAPRTLPEYLRHAALHNAGLKAAFEEWQAALEQIPQAQALPDPKFTYDYFIEQVETRQRVGLMQMFPWFGKIGARTDAAAAAANAAQSRYDAKRLQLFLDVRQVFYEFAYLAGATRVAGESLDLMKHFEEVARTRYLTAAGTQPDVIRAQIEVAKMQDELITLERQRVPTVARLNAVLNRPAEAPLPWPRAEPAQLAQVDRGTVIAALKAYNPELRAMGFDVERFQSEIGVAKRNFYPDIGVGVEWMEMGKDMMGPNDDVMVGLELNLPIWRGSYKAGELQARAMARRAQYEKKNFENDLVARTERALYEFDDSGRKVRLYGDVLVPRARQLIAASEAAYMAGTVDFLSLIDAQRALLQFQLEGERAQANHQQNLAELEMLAGTDLPSTAAAAPQGE